MRTYVLKKKGELLLENTVKLPSTIEYIETEDTIYYNDELLEGS